MTDQPATPAEAVPAGCPTKAALAEPQPLPPPGRLELLSLHGGLLLTNVFWAAMHVIISVPLRRGAHPAVLALYREIVGCATLSTIALATETRPPLTQGVVWLLICNGFIYLGIRLSILQALQDAGPNIVAAIVPTTTVFTLALALLAGVETVRPRSRWGATQLAGMALCCLSSMLMSVYRGPLVFGSTAARGDYITAPPAAIRAGVMLMLLECFLAALVQVVASRVLKVYPLVSTTAGVSFFATIFLIPAALLLAPAAAFRPTPWMAGAAVYCGVFPTAVNQILLSRANKRLGPTTSNLYMPAQQLFTVVIDYLTLDDAVYLSTPVLGLGITLGLAAAVLGKARGDAAAAAKVAIEERQRLLGDEL
jgi:drug/metabolite transporter (DMT)-like permease